MEAEAEEARSQSPHPDQPSAFGGLLTVEPFNCKPRDKLRNREVFTTPVEAKVLIADWRKGYNQTHPHSTLGYRPPAPEARMPVTLTL